jgi:hypothetical protein
MGVIERNKIMPTGYTAKIADGDVSFKEFALGCARAFGACIDMRDDPNDTPIPEKFVADDYHAKKLESAKARLAEAEAVTDAEAELEAVKAHEETRLSIMRGFNKAVKLKLKYLAMLEQATAYVPPSPDHEEFKAFMVQQLSDSMKWDCDTQYYERQLTELKPLSGSEWRMLDINDAKRDIDYHSGRYKEEQDRAESKTVWIQQLKQSLA